VIGERESDGVTAALALEEERSRENGYSDGWEHRAWSMGHGSDHLSREVLIKTQQRTSTGESGNISTEGRLWSKKSESDGILGPNHRKNKNIGR
jgi:hypothetical protein